MLTMCAGNAVVVDDDAENRKLSKAHATGRIDLMVAAIMAVGAKMAHVTEGASFWETQAA